MCALCTFVFFYLQSGWSDRIKFKCTSKQNKMLLQSPFHHLQNLFENITLDSQSTFYDSTEMQALSLPLNIMYFTKYYVSTKFHDYIAVTQIISWTKNN